MSFIKSRPTRRDFLKSGGRAALAAPFLLNGSLPPLRAGHTCVVVGAGLAGLAAAHTLRKAGWNVTVHEARERLGGRVLSHTFKESPNLVCELGGEWIGAGHERVLALCHELGVELQHHRFSFSLMRNNVVEREGSWNYSVQSDVAFEKFRKDFRNYGREEREQMEKADWWTWLIKVGLSEEDVQLRNFINSSDYGESTRHVSAYSVASRYFNSDPANEKDFKVRGGNSRLVSELAAHLGEGTIRLNAPVTGIRQGGGTVFVRAGGEEFRADACICTAPTLVLYKISFDPPLPAEQFAALKRLEYSRIIKSCVLFDERFWDAENFGLVTDGACRLYFHSTQSQPGPQGILSACATGPKADDYAPLDDAKRLELIKHDLRPVSPRAAETARAIVTYDWRHDPYVHGAFAFYRPGSWFTLRPVLQQPHGKVLFAGEHLADEWQGFMEGAVVTGQEAARALIGT